MMRQELHSLGFKVSTVVAFSAALSSSLGKFIFLFVFHEICGEAATKTEIASLEAPILLSAWPMGLILHPFGC